MSIIFYISNQNVYQNYLKRGPQSWNVTGCQENLREILLFSSKNGHLGSLCHRHPHLHGLAHHALGRPAKKASQSVSGSHTPVPGHTPRLSWLSSPLPPLSCHRRSAPQVFPCLRTGCAGSDLSAHSGPFHPTVSSSQAESFPGQGPS